MIGELTDDVTLTRTRPTRASLEEMWRRYEFIVNTSEEFMTLIDRHYRYEAVNEAYCRAHDKSRDDIIGRTVAEVWGHASFEQIIRPRLDACFAGERVSYEAYFEFPGLGPRTFDVTYYPYADQAGQVTRVVVVSRDISRRKQAEEKNLKLLHHLGERIKELTLLHRAAQLLQADSRPAATLLADVATLLPSGWQYPEIATARMTFDGVVFTTPHFAPGPWQQRTDFVTSSGKVGTIELFYLQERPAEDEGPFLAEERTLLEALAEMMRLHFERQEAQEERNRHAAQLQLLSHRLVMVQEAERRHIARELHDEIGQTLTGLKLLLEMAARTNGRSRLPILSAPTNSSLREAEGLVNELMMRVRELSLDLRPSILDDLGLIPALLWHFERYTGQTKIRVLFSHAGLDEQRLPPEVEIAAYRIVQEALTNVVRYAGVDRVVVRLSAADGRLHLLVEEEGRGFDPELSLAAGRSGLIGMRERAALLGGRLTIHSVPGAGTTLEAELPLTVMSS